MEFMLFHIRNYRESLVDSDKKRMIINHMEGGNHMLYESPEIGITYFELNQIAITYLSGQTIGGNGNDDIGELVGPDDFLEE